MHKSQPLCIDIHSHDEEHEQNVFSSHVREIYIHILQDILHLRKQTSLPAQFQQPQLPRETFSNQNK